MKVRILSHSACGSCKVSSYCNAADSKEKIVEVQEVTDTTHLKIGDSVEVCASGDVASRAVLLAFVFPFILIVFVLLFMLHFGAGEGLSAVVSILALLPYYGLLYIYKNRIKKRFSFYIEKE